MRPSIHEYLTPSENCSFWRQRISAGSSGSSSTSKALRTRYFSTSRPPYSLGRLFSGAMLMATSRKASSRKDTRTSMECAMHDLSARRQSEMWRCSTRSIVSYENSSSEGALWK
ncbi:hypothetical protein PMAYCL1PPCAC_09123 [Pristionchus mayeri]|uniref:Uncharacterized protein n=1 Tax=Pristionchus mayeri TaxID=1317129 RepID=A0AAN5C652_9BILA|nr:hypothetical protein PMAYCL1PPCAC_09123 [Pristionchus mayeri]